jgi:hypothetical protein
MVLAAVVGVDASNEHVIENIDIAFHRGTIRFDVGLQAWI